MVAGMNPLINDLSKYGLSATGNIQNDLAALKKAKEAKGESTSDLDNFTAMLTKLQASGKLPGMPSMPGIQQNQGMSAVSGKQQDMQGPVWTSMMQSLGLQLQGSKEADFTAIQAKITQLESATNLTADQKASLATLKAQFEEIKKTEANHPKGHKVGQEGQKPQGEPPWFSMLKNLGLQPQGSPDADFSAMQTKITQMKSTTLPAGQKANLDSMQAQLEQYKLQAPKQ